MPLIKYRKCFQIWKFVCEEDGAYSIENTKYTGHRLAKWGEGDEQTGTYSGRKYEDQVKYFYKYSDDGCRTLHFLHYILSFGISLVTTQTTCRLTELTISISATRNGKITVLLNGEKAMSKLEHMKMQRIFGKLFRRLNGKSGLNGTNLKNKNFATFFGMLVSQNNWESIKIFALNNFLSNKI